MHPREDVTKSVASSTRPDGAPPRRSWPSAALLGGGTDGNEELTSRVGVVLIVLFAVLGVTILQIRQLIWLHLFLGLLLLGPVALKLASTGYRFVRYYARDTTYLRKGPPELALRAMAPISVASTMAVFTSGTVLLFEGPRNRALSLLIPQGELHRLARGCGSTHPGSSTGVRQRPQGEQREPGGLGHGHRRRGALDRARRRDRRGIGAGARSDPTLRSVDRTRRVPAPPPLSVRAITRRCIDAAVDRCRGRDWAGRLGKSNDARPCAVSRRADERQQEPGFCQAL